MAKGKTEWRLADALKEYMQTTPVDHITVGMLTKRAQVTRNTFYYHFTDIYDLLGWIYEQEVVTQLAGYLKVDRWQTAYSLILDYIAANQQFCLQTFHSVARDLLENFLYSAASQMVKGVVEDVDPHAPAALEKSIVNFYGWALVMQVIQWLRDDLQEAPADVIHRAEIMLDGSVRNAMQNSQQH
ncbi:TetR/AcrR family transcriptional regulator [Schleiferilactobacillus perolens]|jgi:probable dihydroxyacetone kinase regulator|uniref:Transcriptional regulator n=1 Tax=Schleiferilactobacillus perolens DSM 12744 TaxID=1423792 RepID=A0A0R1N2X2_9LACO|nr:TetR-like C-terminal domain-containing protein [Schleiferilactobacillus perolens]KRL12708.1 transcriptional regulator [Schleiferilactobacillus perolens DSM 12744]MCI1892410.1 TetR family transcriptional regulator C-terminal domain-containing protein [Schleiferilactobacillus harbinensis]MCI1913301.1 TetR family transcriptional regulator C-terminal domain-containing protein [Schleiferilactobacillus harbinensis]MCI2171385.1 TetR family transcriptional regulator C-terminal domain-containing prot